MIRGESAKENIAVATSMKSKEGMKEKGRRTHDHMLQDMTMDHPNPRLGHSQPPSTPPHIYPRRRLLCVAIQHSRISLCQAQATNPLLVLYRIIRAVPTAQIIIMRPVRVERVRVHATDIAAGILNDDLDDFTDRGGEYSRDWIDALILMCASQRREFDTIISVQRDQIGFSGEGLNPRSRVLRPDCGARGDDLVSTDCDTARDAFGGWEVGRRG